MFGAESEMTWNRRLQGSRGKEDAQLVAANICRAAPLSKNLPYLVKVRNTRPGYPQWLDVREDNDPGVCDLLPRTNDFPERYP